MKWFNIENVLNYNYKVNTIKSFINIVATLPFDLLNVLILHFKITIVVYIASFYRKGLAHSVTQVKIQNNSLDSKENYIDIYEFSNETLHLPGSSKNIKSCLPAAQCKWHILHKISSTVSYFHYTMRELLGTFS